MNVDKVKLNDNVLIYFVKKKNYILNYIYICIR